MNYFRKEELTLLNSCLFHCTPYGEDGLKDKLQSMIDNYCEHPENMSMYSLGVEYCAKCKRKLNE